jgi:cellulose synthase/poly-beta-1,6-N-acetylglucosamine synthase-like glycosyltransferase
MGRGALGSRTAPALEMPSAIAAVGRPRRAPAKVSIHVPAYNEPPEMVIETLDALARLDYPTSKCW